MFCADTKMLKRNIVVLLVLILTFAGCTKKADENVVCYSQYPFTDIAWTRNAENDIETIRFGSDGSFSYSCGCGNPVNDSDLSEGYIYDDETKTITIKYFETTEETISTIKIKECDDKSLTLDFDGEIREFYVE